MNQELKNFDMMMESLKGNIKKQDFGASKTIANIYYEMCLNNMKDFLSDTYIYESKIILNNHHEDFLKLNNSITNEIIPNLIKQNDFKAIHNAQYVQDKIKFFISELERTLNKFGIYNEKSSKTTKDLLELSIKSGTLITQVKESIRGTGKTTELIKKANELGATLIVGTHFIKNYVDTQAREMGYKIDCQYINDYNNLRGRRCKNNKFLVDDSTPNEIILELINSGNEFSGGFNSLRDSLKQGYKFTNVLHTKRNELLRNRDILMVKYYESQTKEELHAIEKMNTQLELISEIFSDLETDNSKI